ncbi:MAG: mechanosensitive ion channel family protein [Cyclobacteriaceae bacterium]|nr:mechanosensitive ion channel family protein [Cyclobacteriaceae bacterium]
MDQGSTFWSQVGFSLSVLAVALIITRITRFLIGRFFRRAAVKLKVDPTRYNFFKNAMDFIIYLIAVVVIFRSIPAFREYGNTLLTGAGILAAAIGFASQSAFSNIISGVFLVSFRPFSVGDRVRIGQLYTGDVEDITLRHTIIKDFENRRIVIPNTVISNEIIINSTITDERVCVFLEIPVTFESDLKRAMKIMEEEALKHRYCIENRSEEDKRRGDGVVVVRTLSVLENGIMLRAWVWARNPTDAFDMKCDLIEAVKLRFDEAGIRIPYPHRVLLTAPAPTSTHPLPHEQAKD